MPASLVYLLSGIIFCLSGYVIVRHFRLWLLLKGADLLPLHVWLITLSYNLLVLSVIIRHPTDGLVAWVDISALAIGVFSLWTVGVFQYQKSQRFKRGEQNVR